MSGSIASAGFGSGFTGALGAVSGAVARAQELAQRQPAADAQELENAGNRTFVDELENGAFARLAQGRQSQGGAPATPPTGGVQAAGQAPQALAPSAPGTPQPPAGQPPAGGAPQAPTGQPPPGGAPQAPAPSAPGAAPQAAPSTGQPGAIAAPGAEGDQPAPNPRREAANASANAGRRTAARLAESLGKTVDQLTQADWQLYSNTVEEIARNHPQSSLARRAVSESIKNRSEALAQQSALAYAALQANDLPGFERAMNSLNGYTASGFTDRVTTQGGNIVLTRTPESGGGQPQVIPLTRQQAENYVMSMANPLTWQQHLETMRRNRADEGLRGQANAIHSRQVGVAEGTLADTRADNAAQVAVNAARQGVVRAEGMPEGPERDAAVAAAQRTLSDALSRIRITPYGQVGEQDRQQQTHTAASGQAGALTELAQAREANARNSTPETRARLAAAEARAGAASSAPGASPAVAAQTELTARGAADQGIQEANRDNAQRFLEVRNQVLANPDNEALAQELAQLRTRLSTEDYTRISQSDSRELQDNLRREQAGLQRARQTMLEENNRSLAERRLAQTEHERATRAGNTAAAATAQQRIDTANRAIDQRAADFAQREQRLLRVSSAINPQRAQQLGEAMAQGLPAGVGTTQQREFTDTAHTFAGPLAALNRDLDNNGVLAWFRGLSGMTPANRNVALASGEYNGVQVPVQLQRAAQQWLDQQARSGPRAANAPTPQTGGALGDIAGRIGARITAPRPPDNSTAPVAGPAASPSAAPNPAAAPAAPTGRIQNGERTSPFNPTPTPTTPDRRVALAVQSYNESRNTAMGRRVPEAQLMEQAAREAGITVEQLRAALGGQ